jgi:hypothetical protein
MAHSIFASAGSGRVHAIMGSGPMKAETLGGEFRFPPKVSSPYRGILSRPFFLFGSLPFVFVFLVLLCRGDAVTMVNNNTPDFGMTMKFSRPKSRKSGHDRECLKALPEV